jgi:hypothetical protein
MATCIICEKELRQPSNFFFCKSCQKSYGRSKQKGPLAGTIAGAIQWAAERTRKFSKTKREEKRLVNKPKTAKIGFGAAVVKDEITGKYGVSFIMDGKVFSSTGNVFESREKADSKASEIISRFIREIQHDKFLKVKKVTHIKRDLQNPRF